MSVQLIKETLQPVVDVANLVTKVQSVVANADKIVPAYQALSDSDKEEVKKWFEENFDLGNDSVEKVIEKGQKVLMDVQPAVNALSDGISLTDVFTLISVLKQVQSDIGTKA